MRRGYIRRAKSRFRPWRRLSVAAEDSVAAGRRLPHRGMGCDPAEKAAGSRDRGLCL